MKFEWKNNANTYRKSEMEETFYSQEIENSTSIKDILTYFKFIKICNLINLWFYSYKIQIKNVYFLLNWSS